MQIALSRIWTWVAMSFSYNDEHYTCKYICEFKYGIKSSEEKRHDKSIFPHEDNFFTVSNMILKVLAFYLS